MTQLTYFYQDEIMGAAGIDAVTIFTALFIAQLVFTLWNMVNDPLLGFLTDRPLKWTKKWGMRVPWILICSGPMLIFYILLWTPPAENVVLIVLYFILITCCFDSFFSIYNDHVYAGFTNQFPTEFERRRGFAIMTIIMGLCLVFMQILLVNIQQPGTGNPGSFLTAAIIMCIFLIVFNIFLFLGIKESPEMKEMFIRGFEETGKMGFFQVLKIS
ncbi:MAG: MFS transporter, partial [Promethearchaeota archaeon]